MPTEAESGNLKDRAVTRSLVGADPGGAPVRVPAEPLEEAPLPGLISDLWPPELGDSKYLCFKPGSWSFVTASLGRCYRRKGV